MLLSVKPVSEQRIIALAVLVAVLAPMIFVSAFILPTRMAAPHHLPIAVAGSPAAARPLLRSIGSVKLIEVSSPAAARHAVRDRRAYGAVVIAAHTSVDVASGESFVVATLLRQRALENGVAPADVHDLAPLPSGDPRGTSLNLVMLALLITSILSGSLMALRLRFLARGRHELILATVAFGVGAGTTGLLKALGALPGPFAADAALVAGLVFAVSLTAAGLVRLRGVAGTSIAFSLFLVIGNPASGLATGRNLLPAPWREYGPLMPPSAAGQAIRGSAFFGGAGDLGPILVLAAWVAVGLALNELGQRRSGPARLGSAAGQTAKPVRDEHAVRSHQPRPTSPLAHPPNARSQTPPQRKQ